MFEQGAVIERLDKSTGEQPPTNSLLLTASACRGVVERLQNRVHGVSARLPRRGPHSREAPSSSCSLIVVPTCLTHTVCPPASAAHGGWLAALCLHVVRPPWQASS